MRPLRLALAQMNPTVGDLRGNADRIIDLIRKAAAQGADLVAFPELAVTGYPPEDLLFKRQFLDDAAREMERIVGATQGITAVVGTPHRTEQDLPPRGTPTVIGGPRLVADSLYNSAAIAHDGRIVTYYHKVFLPNYGVFDEGRYFRAGNECPVLLVNGVRVGVNVCEDIWYDVGPTTVQCAAGAEVIVNINGSPYHRGKGQERQLMLARRAEDHGSYLAYVNMAGGQDELVFDGQSLAFDPTGRLLLRGPQFDKALLFLDIDADAAHPVDRANGELAAIATARTYTIGPPELSEPKAPAAAVICEPLGELAEVYTALVTGTRDYVSKTGFRGVVVGISGGIDSAMTATVAVDALGPEQVTGLFMPSQYTSDQSYNDAKALTANLGIPMRVVPIEDVFGVYLKKLDPLFEGRAPDTAEENLQARIRGNLLMAVSNKLGLLVLTTGNKSEMATGYATLYGDMAGGFAVLKDVPKMLVQALARHRSEAAGREVIPASIIARPPTAELRADQLDEDSLPTYSVLDPILQAYVEEDWTIEQMVSSGMPEDDVARVVRMVDRSEYKRRQSPPGVKITPRAFGRDRRLPIVNRYDPMRRSV